MTQRQRDGDLPSQQEAVRFLLSANWVENKIALRQPVWLPALAEPSGGRPRWIDQAIGHAREITVGERFILIDPAEDYTPVIARKSFSAYIIDSDSVLLRFGLRDGGPKVVYDVQCDGRIKRRLGKKWVRFTGVSTISMDYPDGKSLSVRTIGLAQLQSQQQPQQGQ